MPASKALNDTFALIEAAAIAGTRCPTRDQLPGASGVITVLAREGRVRVEVYPHNWRVVEILKGPHKGKRTAPPSNPKWKPYMVVDTETRRTTAAGKMLPVQASPRIAPPTQAQSQPSAPRTLTREELERIR